MLKLNTLYNMDCMDGMKEFPDNYFDWIGFELDKDYYEAALARFERETAQKNLFVEKKAASPQVETIEMGF